MHPDFPADEGDVKYHQGAHGSSRDLDRPRRSRSRCRPTRRTSRRWTRSSRGWSARSRTVAAADPRPGSACSRSSSTATRRSRGRGWSPKSSTSRSCAGYRTGGTVHLIVNNQIGFTTPPASGRSSLYSTDVAKINQVPIFHVNGDDPEAAWRVLQIALDYRQEFHKDVVIDLIGFRLHGHNEGDEPTYTQPLMYRRIQEHPGVRTIYAKKLVQEGVLTEAEVAELEERRSGLREGSRGREGDREPRRRPKRRRLASRLPCPALPRSRTAVAAETLARIGRVLTTVPAGFHLNPKMVSQLARRAKMAEGAQPLDWSTAEALAFGSLLLEGTPIRLSGQDTSRGTFSQRHIVFHDTTTGETWTPLSELDPAQASLSVYDSPLSEVSVLGFEYGYSVEAPETLVLWEAQYGDFANGAQVIIDQFVSSAEDKWQQATRLGLLLPHGYEGQGPEHSSARIERYLQLCAEDNMQVCNVTTPGQYFHLLRRQMRQPHGKPLVLFTPKSLLRFPASFSPLEELASGRFQTVIDDGVADRAAVSRVLFCSGKVFYDLTAAREEKKVSNVAIVRVEQLYPFPEEELRRRSRATRRRRTSSGCRRSRRTWARGPSFRRHCRRSSRRELCCATPAARRRPRSRPGTPACTRGSWRSCRGGVG